MKTQLRIVTSTLFAIALGSSTLLAAQASDPLAGLFATQNIFDGLINQNDAPTGAILLRTTKPMAGVGYITANADYKSKGDSIDSKTKADGTDLFLYGIYSFSNGLHLGVTQENIELKFKSDDSTAKIKHETTTISLAAALKNGFGLGLALDQNKEEISFGSFSKDITYGQIRPELYYSAANFDLIVRHSPTMRHETSASPGFVEVEGELKLDDSKHLLAALKHKRDSEVGDDERNHFAMSGGLRYLYDPQNSNIVARILLEEAYAAGPRNGEPSNTAMKGVSLDLAHSVAPGHMVGGKLQYEIGDGKGSDSRGNGVKLSKNETNIGLSYCAKF